MPVSPGNFVSLALERLRSQLAQCSTFQAEVGAASATAALDSIHYVDTTTTDPPFAVIDYGDRLSMTRHARGERNHASVEGELRLILRFAITSTDTEAEAALRFLNAAGGILAELWQLAGAGGYLDLLRVDQAGPAVRPSVKEAKSKGDFYQVEYLVEYEGAVL